MLIKINIYSINIKDRKQDNKRLRSILASNKPSSPTGPTGPTGPSDLKSFILEIFKSKTC